MATKEASFHHSTDITIDRRSSLSYNEFVSEYLIPRKPVIITDGVAHWPALSKWTPEYFRTVLGEKRVKVDNVEMRMGDFIDLVLASTELHPSPYLTDPLIRQEFPEIAPDILPELKYVLPDRVRSRLLVGTMKSRSQVGRLGITELLISGVGGTFRLHYDTLHMLGFVTQIHGDKEFMLFAPGDSKYLYPLKDPPNYSHIVNTFSVDLDKFPLFAKATPHRFILRPGETIFNPPGWWHMTRILSPSIAMVHSTISSSNWDVYVDDYASRPRKGVPHAVSLALRMYLSLVGIFLSAHEILFFRGFE